MSFPTSKNFLIFMILSFLVSYFFQILHSFTDRTLKYFIRKQRISCFFPNGTGKFLAAFTSNISMLLYGTGINRTGFSFWCMEHFTLTRVAASTFFLIKVTVCTFHSAATEIQNLPLLFLLNPRSIRQYALSSRSFKSSSGTAPSGFTEIQFLLSE